MKMSEFTQFCVHVYYIKNYKHVSSRYVYSNLGWSMISRYIYLIFPVRRFNIRICNRNNRSWKRKGSVLCCTDDTIVLVECKVLSKSKYTIGNGYWKSIFTETHRNNRVRNLHDYTEQLILILIMANFL